MAERGAQPALGRVRRRLLDAVRAWSNPLTIDEYLQLADPAWTTSELRGRVERIVPRTDEASTVYIRPAWSWPGHRPGQYIRIGVDIDGVRHWRAYTLTCTPDEEDGLIAITPKRVEGGAVSGWIIDRRRLGELVVLSDVEGGFHLPEEGAPAKLLFLTAGSGITPVMAMLRDLEQHEAISDIVHVHSSPAVDKAIFGDELRSMDEYYEGYRLIERHTDDDGRVTPDELDELVPDWREREAWLCGPPEMLDEVAEHYDQAGLREQLHVEHFQPGGPAGEGELGDGGEITFTRSNATATSDGSIPILDAGEEVGLQLEHGCRMGICHTCTGTLKEGQVRDLRSGEVHGTPGETIRICINAPEGPVEVEL